MTSSSANTSDSVNIVVLLLRDSIPINMNRDYLIAMCKTGILTLSSKAEYFGTGCLPRYEYREKRLKRIIRLNQIYMANLSNLRRIARGRLVSHLCFFRKFAAHETRRFDRGSFPTYYAPSSTECCRHFRVQKQEILPDPRPPNFSNQHLIIRNLSNSATG